MPSLIQHSLDFYVEPAFFIIAALLAIPAIVMGFLGKNQKYYGAVVSAFFMLLLFWGNPSGAASFVGFVALCTILTFIELRMFANAKSTTHAIAWYRFFLGVVIALLLLVKIAGVFDANLFGFIGISYATFKALQVLIEIRDGLIKQGDMTLFEYVYFMVFFTPFISGPIMRSRDFVAQLRAMRPKHDYQALLSSGVIQFAKGALYSFVFAGLSNWLMWLLPSLIGGDSAFSAAAAAITECFFYGLYLFFDFAGYSAMAIGLGAAFGIEVPRNFNAPFLATDIKEFWNRWHMSLSYWLRDFVFMRFTRYALKKKLFASRVTVACVGYLINMTLMGIWHALTLDCVIYGLFHGVLLAGCELMQKKSKFYKAHKNQHWFKVCLWLVTMIGVFIGFALFSGQMLGGGALG